jgi:replicative DNA helicase
MTESLPPSSDSAERSVLGSILIDADAIHRVRDIIRPEMFYQERHQWVYQAMCALSDDGVPPDFLTVTDALEQRGQLEQAGDFSYITGLINATPTSLRAEHYAQIVRRDHIRRKAIAYGAKVVQAAYQSDDVDDLMGTINQGVMELETQQVKSGPVPIATVVSELYEDLEQWQNDPLPPNAVRGLSTGIPEWDKMMGGMENGESFVIIAARPRVGKTILAITSAYRMARMGKRVLVFALEMKGRTLVARLASADSEISYKKVKRGVKDGSSWYPSGQEYSEFTTAALKISSANNLYVDESQNLTVSQIRARAMTLAHRLGGLDLIVVDTGNLVQSESVRGKNFAQTESEKVRGIRNLVKELDCVGYMTWQLSKAIDSRPTANFGRAPKIGDLRDTGGVEEHASDVIGLYRDELYVENSEYKRVMHLFALKRRNDEDSTMQTLGFDPEFQRFYSVDLQRKELGVF